MNNDLEIPAFLDRRPKKPDTKPGEIPISQIRDAGAQVRAEMYPDTIRDYADDMLDGAVFPPIILFHDGTQYWLADGYHRLESAKKIKREIVAAEVRQGTARDAILYGIGANASHGLRRTQADKRRAIERLLKDPEWSQMSDRKLAAIAKVDHKTVGNVRRELTAGEIPTDKPLSREFPALSGKQNADRTIHGSILQSISDNALIAECRRRGLVVNDA